MTIFEVKQKAIDALGAVDLSKLSLNDLTGYVQALTALHGIQEDKTDMFKSALEKLSMSACTCNSFNRPTIGELSENK